MTRSAILVASSPPGSSRARIANSSPTKRATRSFVARGAARPHGDVDQHFVADAVAVEIVDALERIEIEKQHRMRAVTVRRRRYGIFQLPIEAAAVRQPGERILAR